MPAELSIGHRKLLTEAVVHGRISPPDDATDNDATPFDADAAEALVSSGHLTKEGKSFVVTDKGRAAERKLFSEHEGHARDEVPPSKLRNPKG